MLPDRQDPLWSVAIHTSAQVDPSASTPTLRDALHQAFTERPDLAAGVNSLQQLSDSRMLLAAAQRARQLAEEQYASEQRQFKAGTSSVFLVLQRQNEFISARLREIRATADSGETEADLDRATANTLKKTKH